MVARGERSWFDYKCVSCLLAEEFFSKVWLYTLFCCGHYLSTKKMNSNVMLLSMWFIAWGYGNDGDDDVSGMREFWVHAGRYPCVAKLSSHYLNYTKSTNPKEKKRVKCCACLKIALQLLYPLIKAIWLLWLKPFCV